MTSSSVSSIPSTAALRSASKPASPVTQARNPVASPSGGGTMPRITATACSAVGVLSSRMSTALSPSALSPESETGGARSSGSVRPQASAYGVPTRLIAGISPDEHSASASASIRARSSEVSPPSRS